MRTLALLALVVALAACARPDAVKPPLASGDPAVDVAVGDLAATRPSASRVLQEHGIDFCCGGRRTLAEASAERGLDAKAILAEIDAADRAEGDGDFVRWGERPPAELVRHIVERYHTWLRKELPRLRELSAKVDRAHADKASRPMGLSEHLATVSAEIEEHLRREEQDLFPRIEARTTAHDAHVKESVDRLVHDHEALAVALRRTRQITNDLTPPPEACPTWRALYSGLTELEEEIHQHAHLENNVLFPRLGAS